MGLPCGRWGSLQLYVDGEPSDMLNSLSLNQQQAFLVNRQLANITSVQQEMGQLKHTQRHTSRLSCSSGQGGGILTRTYTCKHASYKHIKYHIYDIPNVRKTDKFQKLYALIVQEVGFYTKFNTPIWLEGMNQIMILQINSHSLSYCEQTLQKQISTLPEA